MIQRKHYLLPVETVSKHSEPAYHVETDSSLTEDYEASDQVVPTEVLIDQRMKRNRLTLYL